jgi:hypothetical protein
LLRACASSDERMEMNDTLRWHGGMHSRRMRHAAGLFGMHSTSSDNDDCAESRCRFANSDRRSTGRKTV